MCYYLNVNFKGQSVKIVAPFDWLRTGSDANDDKPLSSVRVCNSPDCLLNHLFNEHKRNL